MAIARLVVIGVSTLLLGAGYLVSQASYFSGTTQAYIEGLDASPVPLISLILLVCTVVLAFVPEKGEEE